MKNKKEKTTEYFINCKSYEEIECPYYPTDFMKGFYAAKGWSIPGTYKKSICNGTRERDECRCGGNRCDCTFYDDIKKEAIEEASRKNK